MARATTRRSRSFSRTHRSFVRFQFRPSGARAGSPRRVRPARRPSFLAVARGAALGVGRRVGRRGGSPASATVTPAPAELLPLAAQTQLSSPPASPPTPVALASDSSRLGALSLARLLQSAVGARGEGSDADRELHDQIEAFLLDQASPHTQRAYRKDLERFLKYLVVRSVRGGRPRTEPITREVIVGYKDQLTSEGLEPTTVDRHLSTLRSFFRWLVEGGVIERNPALGVRFMRVRKVSTTQAFTDEEVRALLAQPDLHTHTGALHYAVLMVLFFCGLRRSELCALTTQDLSVERGSRVLRVRGKGGRERLIPLLPAVWNAIAYYLRMVRRRPGDPGPLFVGAKRGPRSRPDAALDPSAVFYLVRKHARAAGVTRRVSPHSCRATAISNARDRKVADRAIQEFAGWASTDMITRYDKRRTAIVDSAAWAIEYGEIKQTATTEAENAPNDSAQSKIN